MARQDTPAYVPTAAQKYGKNTTVTVKEVLIEEHVSLDEDEEEVARREALVREEKRLQDEAEARAAAWAAGKKDAEEARRKADEAERAAKLRQQQAESGVSDKPAEPRPEAVGVDEDGIPIYSVRISIIERGFFRFCFASFFDVRSFVQASALDKMETGQIVISLFVFLLVFFLFPAKIHGVVRR